MPKEIKAIIKVNFQESSMISMALLQLESSIKTKYTPTPDHIQAIQKLRKYVHRVNEKLYNKLKEENNER